MYKFQFVTSVFVGIWGFHHYFKRGQYGFAGIAILLSLLFVSILVGLL